eukprot:12435882-Alexandrium_andersonii.AAC.1
MCLARRAAEPSQAPPSDAHDRSASSTGVRGGAASDDEADAAAAYHTELDAPLEAREVSPPPSPGAQEDY